MILNRASLVLHEPIKNMLGCKKTEHGVSYGLTELGYDIRVKQEIRFKGHQWGHPYLHMVDREEKPGYFALASSIEEFQMPKNLGAIVHDKSTWARRGLSVFNTVIEPGWNGFLTLELVYHGQDNLVIPAGSGIAQVIFHEVSDPYAYDGKYQNQAD